MPIYDFKCTECDHQAEMIRKISADSTMECPVCYKTTFSKMLSAPSFQLNGTGWYATDFGSNPKSTVKSDSKDESTMESKITAAEPAVAAGKDVSTKA